MRIEVVTAATSPVVVLDEAKRYLRVTHTQDNDLITSLISAATEIVEKVTNRYLLSTTLKVWYDIHEITSSRSLSLACPPVQSVNTITCYDTSDNSYVVDSANYSLDNKGIYLNRLLFSSTWSWPLSLRSRSCVCVEQISGWSMPAAVPQAIKQTILLLTSSLYDERTTGLMRDVMTDIRRLLQPYRAWSVNNEWIIT